MQQPLQVEENAPWKQRYRAPVIAWTQLAQGMPARGLAVSNRSGSFQLHAWERASGELRQLTDRSTNVFQGWISPDGRWVYYLHDEGGNEIGHYMRIPFAGGPAQDVTPDLPPYSSFSFDGSRIGNRLGFTLARAEGFQCYAIDLVDDDAAGAPRLLYRTARLAFGPLFSYGGEIAVIASTERATVQHYSLLALDSTSGEQFAELWEGEGHSLGAVAFSPQPGDFRLLGTTNHTGVTRPLVWNPRTGERIDLPCSELEGEVLPVDWSPDASRILLCQVHQARQQLYRFDLDNQVLTRLDHPGGAFTFFAGRGVYFGPAGELYAQWEDATHPSQLIELDGQTGALRQTVLDAGETPPSRPWQSITFPSVDGQLIQGWLALPGGEGPFPAILDTHGGPEAVVTEAFSPDCQAWLDHGIAYLTINYRGSTTFGRDFQEKIWGNPGHLELSDMVAARDWLVQQGIARADQILLTGWSYGGYLTLLGLGKRPDLWAGGMAGVAIADWAMQYEDSADTLKGYQRALFGGTPQEKPEQYAASSPITYAYQVQAPVLIIQGRNDTRTPARPVEQYETKLKQLGKQVEVHWFEAGHSGAGVEQAIRHQELMLRFAGRVLG
jgi:dienelactone hydrolase